MSLDFLSYSSSHLVSCCKIRSRVIIGTRRSGGSAAAHMVAASSPAQFAIVSQVVVVILANLLQV